MSEKTKPRELWIVEAKGFKVFTTEKQACENLEKQIAIYNDGGCIFKLIECSAYQEAQTKILSLETKIAELEAETGIEVLRAINNDYKEQIKESKAREARLKLSVAEAMKYEKIYLDKVVDLRKRENRILKLLKQANHFLSMHDPDSEDEYKVFKNKLQYELGIIEVKK